MAQEIQKLVRVETFPLFGNLCLIYALRELGIEISIDNKREEVTAIFNFSQISHYEDMKKVLNKKRFAVSA